MSWLDKPFVYSVEGEDNQGMYIVDMDDNILVSVSANCVVVSPTSTVEFLRGVWKETGKIGNILIVRVPTVAAQWTEKPINVYDLCEELFEKEEN